MLKILSSADEHSEDEVAVLVRRLHETQQRLQEIAGGEVDAVLHPGGHSYMLHEAQEKLRESEAFTRLLVKASNIGLWDWNLVTQEVFLSPEWKSQLGYTDAELTNCLETWESLLHPEDREATLAGVHEYLAGRRADYEQEFRLRHKDGSWRWMLTRADLTCNDVGQPVRIMGCHIDVTERKSAEEALRESEARYRRLFENMREGYVYSRLLYEEGRAYDYIFLAVNDAFAEQTGLHDVVGKKVSEVVPGMHEANPEQLVIYSRVAVTGQPERFETYAKQLDIWFSVTVYSHEKEHFIAMFENITERKRTEEALQQQTTELRVLFDLVPAMIFSKDTRNRYLRVNSRVTEGTGFQIEDIEGKSAYDIFPEHADKFYEGDLEVIESGMPRLGIVEKVPGPGAHPSFGQEKWMQTDKVPVFDKAGRVTGLIVMAQDITERKLAAENVERLAAIVQSSDDAIISKSLKGIITSWNPKAEKMFGYREEEIIGQPMQVLVPADRHGEEAEILDGFTRGELVRHFETVRVRKNGQTFDVSATISPIRDPEGNIVGASCILRDITERKRAEASLLESERRLALATQSVQLGIWDWQVVADEMLWDAQMYAIYGIDAEDFSGAYDAWQKGLHPDDRKRAEAELAAALTGKDNFDTEFRIVWPNGEVRDIEAHALVERAGDGSAIRMIGVNRDITERKQAESRLRQNQKLLNMASRIGRLGAWSIDLTSGLLSWSAEVREIHETPPDFVPTVENAIAFYTPAGGDTVRTAVGACMDDGTPFDVEVQITTAKGRLLWVRAIGEAVWDESGAIVRVQGAFQDIDDQKKAELDLAGFNRALKVLSSCNETLVRAENELELLNEICRTAVEEGGYHMAWVGFAQDDDAKTISPQAHAGVEDGYLSTYPISWNQDDPSGRGPVGRTVITGQTNSCADLTQDIYFARWLPHAQQRGYRSLICLPLRDEKRTFGALTLYSAEVGPTKAEELKLLQEMADDLAFGVLNLRARLDQRRLQAAVLKVSVGVSAASGTAFFEQLVHNMTEALGAQAGFVSELLPGEPLIARTVAAVADGESQKNIHYFLEDSPCVKLPPDGECIYLDQVAKLFPQTEMLSALGAEAYVGQRLNSSTGQQLGTLSVLFREPLKDPEFVVSTLRIFAARAASELERKQTDAQLREKAALLDIAHEAIYVTDLEGRIIYWNRGAEETYGWSAGEALGCKSSELLAEEAISPEAELTMLSEGEWHGEVVKRAKDGRDLTVEVGRTLVRDAEGQPKSVLAINTDITERKKLNRELLRAQRMDSLGTLAGGIAHDLNNALGPIILALDLLKARFPDEASQKLLAIVGSSAHHGADMVRQILSFARGVEGERITVHLEAIIKKVGDIVTDTFPKNIRLQTTIAPDLGKILGDPTQFHQVLLNLCINARDAMENGGKLAISAKNLVIDSHFAGLIPDAAAGPYVLLQVEDSGTGMPPEVIEKIFDPFFTTKEFGKGTGLGLSSCMAIIKSHGGFLRVESQPGVGTKFNVYFPAMSADEAELEPITNETLPHGRGEMILVIDDEASVRQITQQTLETFGYRVVLAADGAEGVAMYATHGAEIAAVLTDMMMPIMDGPSTIQVLQRMNPQVQIIGASGLSSGSADSRAASLGVQHFLHKPYSAGALLMTLKQIIERTTPPAD